MHHHHILWHKHFRTFLVCNLVMSCDTALASVLFLRLPVEIKRKGKRSVGSAKMFMHRCFVLNNRNAYYVVWSAFFIFWLYWIQMSLGGVFKYFLVSPLFRETINFEKYFSNWLKPPTRSSLKSTETNMRIWVFPKTGAPPKMDGL